MRFLYICALAGSVFLYPGRATGFDLDLSTYSNKKIGVKVHAPNGWLVYRHSGYPAVLMVMIPPAKDASLSLAVTSLEKGGELKKTITQDCNAMRAVGLVITQCGTRSEGQTGELIVAGHTADGKTALRQYYLHEQNRVFILTLTGGPNVETRYISALLMVLETMEIMDEQDSASESSSTPAVQTQANPPAPLERRPESEDRNLPELDSAPPGEGAEEESPPSTRPTPRPSR